VGGSGTYREIAERYGTSATALHRHKKEHLPLELVKAQEAQEVAQAGTLLGQIMDLQTRTLSILQRAEKAGDLRTALQAVREARGNLELLARMMTAAFLTEHIDPGIDEAMEENPVEFVENLIHNLGYIKRPEIPLVDEELPPGFRQGNR
jgi:hypothetical protein